MSQDTLGWVMDKATSKRRLHVGLHTEAAMDQRDVCVRLTVSVTGRPPSCVDLDTEGLGILQGLIRAALARLVLEGA